MEGISRHANPGGYTELDNYLAQTAIDSLALGVRREIDRDEQRCARARAARARAADGSRARYAEGVKTDAPDDARDASRWFDAYAEPGELYISVDRVQADIDRLREATARVKTFVDEQAAHWQLDQHDRLDPSAVDRALGEIRRVVLRYHGLRWPGQLLLDTTPIADRGFLRTFTTDQHCAAGGYVPRVSLTTHSHIRGGRTGSDRRARASPRGERR